MRGKELFYNISEEDRFAVDTAVQLSKEGAFREEEEESFLEEEDLQLKPTQGEKVN